MTLSRLIAPFVAIFIAAGVAAGADLSRIERQLKKEPAYKGTPRYALLVFGPEAKSRAWIVQDGDVLYVDRNGNGDLTEEGERVATKAPGGHIEAGNLSLDGLTHKDLIVSQMVVDEKYVENAAEWRRIKAQSPDLKVWWVRIKAERPKDDKRDLPRHLGYVANGDGVGFLLFAARPADAPVIHFNGPWTLGLQDIKHRFTVGQKSNLQIGIGTPGVGAGSFTFLLYPDTIPNDAYPVADIAFPPSTPGGEPVRERFVLKDRC